MRKTAVFVFAAAAVTLGAVGSAFSADMPTKAPVYKAPPPPPPPVYMWTGWYAGVNGGYGWNNHNDLITVNEYFAGIPFDYSGTWPGYGNFGYLNADGGIFGGQVGYNWQSGALVFGLEGDIQWSGIKGDASGTIPYPIGGAGPFDTFSAHVSQKLDWFGTVRARLGYAHDRALFYATGGFVYGKVKYNLDMSDTFGFYANGSDDDSTGWTVGGGIEYLIAPHWTFKGEYQFLDFGNHTISATEFVGGVPTDFSVSADVKSQFHTVRAGLNYKW